MQYSECQQNVNISCIKKRIKEKVHRRKKIKILWDKIVKQAYKAYSRD